MSDQEMSNLARQFAQPELIAAAVRRGVKEALIDHCRAGRKVPIWRSNQVVWVDPLEILANMKDSPPNGNGASAETMS